MFFIVEPMALLWAIAFCPFGASEAEGGDRRIKGGGGGCFVAGVSDPGGGRSGVGAGDPGTVSPATTEVARGGRWGVVGDNYGVPEKPSF